MKKYLQSCISIFVLLLLHNGNVQAQIVAFPGAEGAGKNTTGGRGTLATATKVFAVTSLADDGSAGTLRWALAQPATYRTIIFRISGTIHLTSALKFNRTNTTIAGQTAPGEGICLADYPVSVSANNVIIRYMRFRMGDKNENKGMVDGSGNDDAFDGTGVSNVVIDHCTMSWSNDEACTFYRGDSLTLQWNLISEPLNYSYHFETGDADFEHHGYGGIWGGKHASFHHNLLAHCQGRAPRFDGSRNLGNGSTPGLENADFENNVIYDWGSYNTNGGEGGNYNIVNNYYKYGPSTSHNTSAGVKITTEIINPFEQAAPVLPYGKYYLSGNYVDAASAVTADNWKGASFSGGSLADSTQSKVTVPFTIVPLSAQTAADAYNSVLSKTGCSLPNRDTLDARIVNDVINRTGRIIDVQGGYPHGTAYALTVNAWPFLLSTPAPATTNTDNIPDVWLAQRGLTGAVTSGPGGYHSNGYTHLENFLNGDSIVAPGTLNNCVFFTPVVSTNSGNWVDAKDSSYGYYASSSYLVSTDTNNVIASILDNGNFGAFNGSYYTTNITRYSLNILFGNSIPYLNRNIDIRPVTNTGTGSSVTVRFYFTKAEFDSLKAADTAVHSLADLAIYAEGEPDALVCSPDLLGSPISITPSSYGTYGTYQTGYYLEFSTNSFSTFFVARKTTPVPLKLISFAAVAAGSNVTANWATQNEINTKKFIIERSADARNFNAVGSVPAKNLNGTNKYAFTDTDPLSGISYYRLKMIDINGAYQYSNIVAVKFNNGLALTVNPNPAVNSITVSFPKTASSVSSLQIISSDGRKVMQPLINTGSNISVVNISALPKGIYEIRFSDKAELQTTKFIKE